MKLLPIAMAEYNRDLDEKRAVLEKKIYRNFHAKPNSIVMHCRDDIYTGTISFEDIHLTFKMWDHFGYNYVFFYNNIEVFNNIDLMGVL